MSCYLVVVLLCAVVRLWGSNDTVDCGTVIQTMQSIVSALHVKLMSASQFIINPFSKCFLFQNIKLTCTMIYKGLLSWFVTEIDVYLFSCKKYRANIKNKARIECLYKRKIRNKNFNFVCLNKRTREKGRHSGKMCFTDILFW